MKAKQVTDGNFLSNTVTGSTWTSDSGNSSNPPVSIGSFISVIVSTNITRNSKVTIGNITQLVVLKVDNPSGYQPDPSRSRTGILMTAVK